MFFFSKLMDYGEKEGKRQNLVLAKLQRVRNEWYKDRTRHLDFINKRLHEIMKQDHTSKMLTEQCISTIRNL